MIDLTPLDVRKKSGDFRRSLRGYDPEEVDTFMDLVAERLEELVRENLSLSEKTETLEHHVEALEGREKAVQEALVLAQKLREDVKDQSARDAESLRDQANRSAEILKKEAEAEIARRISEAEGLVHERRRALEELERSRLRFLKSFRALLERELDAVEVEEARNSLEDTPLDLDLRGWTPAGEVEEEEDVGEVEVDSVASGAEEEEEEGPDDQTQGGPRLVVDVESLALDVEEAMPDLGGPGTGGLGGPEAGDLGGPEAGDLGGPEAGDLGGPEAGEVGEDEEPSLPGTPKWLFSLLKKEEEEG